MPHLDVQHHLHHSDAKHRRKNSNDDQDADVEDETEFLWWLPPEAGKADTSSLKHVAEISEKHGLPEQHVVGYLEREIAAADSCHSLPFTLLLVVSYTLMVIYHLQAPWVAAVEDSLRFDILDNANFAFTRYPIGHKDMYDVNSLSDFWSWMSSGLVPLLWNQEYLASEIAIDTKNAIELAKVASPIPRRNRGVWLEYNRIVTGVRLSQERDDDTSKCEHFGGLDSFYNRGCTGGTGYELEPELLQARVTTDPKSREYLYIHENMTDIASRVYELERDGWLDERTKKVEIAIPVYNGEYGLHCMVYANFFFSRGGRIWKAIIPMSAFEYWFASPWSWVWDSVWFLCIMWIIVTETIEIGGVIRRHGAKGLWTVYVGFWNTVDWFSAVTGVGLIIGFFINLANVSGMNTLVEELGTLDEVTQQEAYRAKGREYMDALEVEVQFMYYFKLAISSYPLVIVIRLFKAFSAQPRLAIVTRTLVHSSVDLAHFLIIWTSVFIMYAIAAVVLFGREVSDYTTTFRSVTSCFRAMLGDFEWDELREVGRLDASFWFIPFNLLVSIILLNMLIAMVMDAYSDVVDQVGNTDTLWREAAKAYKRWRLTSKGEAAHMETILSVLQKEVTDRRRAAEAMDPEMVSKPSMMMSKKSANFESGGRAAEKAALRARLRATRWIITVHTLKNIIQAELGEKKSTCATAQAQQILAQGMVYYIQENREKPDVEEVVGSFRKIGWRVEKLRRINETSMTSRSLARNRKKEVMEWMEECTTEVSAAQKDLQAWYLEDEDDVPLDSEMLRAIEQAKNTKVCECGNVFMDDSIFCRKCGRKREQEDEVVKPQLFTGAAHLEKGTWHKVIDDMATVLQSCRDTGLSSKQDFLRRAAVGKAVQVVERDDLAGTVKCKVPGHAVAVWLGLGAFGISMDDPTGAQKASEAQQVLELEQELAIGKETVEEALQAVTDLHVRLQRTRAEKDSAAQKFATLKDKATKLSKENRSCRDRFQQGQHDLKLLTIQRDEHFERVKALMEENREVKLAIEEAKARVAGKQGQLALKR